MNPDDLDQYTLERMPTHVIEALKARKKEKPPDREEIIVERAMHDVGVRIPERMEGKRVRVVMEVIS